MQTTEEESPIADIRHSPQRKAAIVSGKGTDYAGDVYIVPISNFDLNKTIFSTVEGALPRMVMEAKIAKEVRWNDDVQARIDADYERVGQRVDLPSLDAALISFMEKECDFSMEHADGSFLEHLYFCYEYSFHHFPSYSPKVMFLHSILGTATNTFAMKAVQIPDLAVFLDDFELLHISAFPSIFRLIGTWRLLEELTANLSRLDRLSSISFFRVIDNEPMRMKAEDLWIHLNYQLMHYVDFLPTANWSFHASDPLLQSFRALSVFLDRAEKRMAKVDCMFPQAGHFFSRPQKETLSFGGHVSSVIPAFLKRRLSEKALRRFSAKINHDLSYQLHFD
ncbi:MAG: hypothetical protein VX278_14350 [Myxococcota bacterium]|nr:hypothetical protein [Myxococcota bacterium]